MKIRPELPADSEAVRAVNQAAFGTNAEADLVERLRVQASPLISLVADDSGSIVGDILFSPAILTGGPDEVFMALELESGIFSGKTGTIRYHAAFAHL